MRPEHFSEQFDIEDNPYNDYDKWRDLRDERDFRAGLRAAALYTKYADEREAQQDAKENDGVPSSMDAGKNTGFEDRELRD